MTVFFKTDNGARVMLPWSNIFAIRTSGPCILISYFAGEYVEFNGSFVKKLELQRINYASKEYADYVFARFYDAVSNDDSVFDFAFCLD